jgi:hypothetical protein
MRNGHKPRRDQAVDIGENPTDLPAVEAHQLKSLPRLPADEAGMQLGFDALDEPAELLIRVSTAALEGEDDLVDEGDEIEELVEPEPIAEVAEVAEAPELVEPEPVAEAPELVEPEPVAEVAEAPELVEQLDQPQQDEAAQAADDADDADAADDADLSAGPLPYEPAQTTSVDDSSLQIRLARIHLKTGSFVMARAELEALAARDHLDTSANLDLAEVRWRTGDLHGAGEAAAAYMADGGDEALGFVIAAEAAAMANRHGEARRHTVQALQRHLSELDPVFAGIPRKATWNSGAWNSAANTADALSAEPNASAAPVEPAAIAALEPIVEPVGPEVAAREASVAAREASVAAREASVAVREGTTAPEAPVEPEVALAVAAAESSAWTPAPAEQPVAPTEPQAATPDPIAPAAPPAEASAAEPTPNVVAAGAEVESGLAYLDADDPMMAALHFGVAIRLAPESANAVLDAVGDRQDLPLQLVRGDALRLLGLEGDAGKAYMSVASALGAPRIVTPETASDAPTGSAESAPAAKSAKPKAAAAPADPEPPAEPEGPELPPIRWD